MGEEAAPLRAPAGTHDVLWPESARWERLVAEFARRGASWRASGSCSVPCSRTPQLFRRGIGDESDVVRKEMYEFEDRGGRAVALRPEGTASVVRAFVQHHPPVPWKAWYVTPAFRYERPQAGRYKQHHQLGWRCSAPTIPTSTSRSSRWPPTSTGGWGSASVDLAVNSMGCGECRAVYVSRPARLSRGPRRRAVRRAP